MPDINRVVFVVEDEGIIAQALAIMLNQAGFQASAFDHPEKAIAASAQLTPALLISDVMMPGMTGVELAIHFRRSHPDYKVPLFSGQAATADLLKRLAQRVTTSIYSRNLSIPRIFWQSSECERSEPNIRLGRQTVRSDDARS